MSNLKYLTHIGALSFSLMLLSACGGGSKDDGSKVTTMQSVETIDQNDTLPTPQAKNPETPLDAEPTPQLPAPVTPVAPSATVKLSGMISYDRVAFDSRLYKGLDFEATTEQPARGVTVNVISSTGSVIESTQTDEQGRYQFDVAANTRIRIRVIAEIAGYGGADWSIQVKDNTRSNALYVLDGSLANTGSNEVQTRNLHAESGWDGNSYSQTRSAAPFAVLDSLYDAVKTVTSASSNLVLPPLDIFWSKNNIAISGNLNEGKIGTSFYTSAGPAIYLLGAENNDTDEFDRGVVQHEFGHYIEHQLSRTESLGGSHNVNSLLDLRVAFGEAWGNAFSGMVSGDPVYRDSLGINQDLGFAINVRLRSFGAQGWFSEGSIQSILYNLFDSENSSDDNISLGFKPIFDVLISDEYLNHEGFASIYSFIEVLKRQNPNDVEKITQLVNGYNIYGTGFYGENESNDGGSSVTLPVYASVDLNQTTNVCSDSAFQNYNGVDVYRLIKIDISSSGNYRVSATKSSSSILRTNPQIRIYRGGEQIASFTSATNDVESGSTNLNKGTYILEVFEQSNAATNNNNGGGLACFNVTLSRG